MSQSEQRRIIRERTATGLLAILLVACVQVAPVARTAPPASSTPRPLSPLPLTLLPPAGSPPTAVPTTPGPPAPTPEPPLTSPTAAPPLTSPTPTLEPLGDGVHWTRHPANPVFDVGPPGTWEDTLVTGPRVLKTDAGFYMIYAGFDGTRESGEFSPFYGYALGVAASSDGVGWERYALNPALSLSAGEFGTLWHDGLIVEGEFHTYYSRGSTRDGRTGLRIYLATSSDGLAWTPLPEPVIDLGSPGAYDDFDVFAPTVLVEDDVFKMWYTASQDGVGTTIAYATSTDGLTWSKYAGNPVLAEVGAWSPTVFKAGETYMMWYTLEGSIHLATSLDGITWTPHPDNPVLTPDEEGAWDSESVGEASIYFDGSVFHMWYAGSSGPFQDKIGYATSP